MSEAAIIPKNPSRAKTCGSRGLRSDGHSPERSAPNASRMALKSDGKHRVSLDKVIKTMRDTGRDMKDKYKETSRGGLAVNVIEC